MAELIDLLNENKKLNKFLIGFKWSLWNLLPLIGNIVVTIMVLNKLFVSTSKKIGMFIFLVIPCVNLIGMIVFIILIVKRIGGKFFLGYIIVPFFMVVSLASLLAILAIPKFNDASAKAKISEVPTVFASYEHAQLAYLSETGTIGHINNIGFDGIENSRWFIYKEDSPGTFTAIAKESIGGLPMNAILSTTINEKGQVTHSFFGTEQEIISEYLPYFISMDYYNKAEYSPTMVEE